MPTFYEGSVSAKGFRFAIVVSDYNDFVTERLLHSAVEALRANGAEDQDIYVFKVPGAFEIPQMARKAAESRKYHAIICLGALIRGKTRHFKIISEECAKGIQRVASDYGIPLTFGVITAENLEQAVERSGENSSNRGWEAAVAAIQMANLYSQIS